jgi:hypothetical protein
MNIDRISSNDCFEDPGFVPIGIALDTDSHEPGEP